MLTFVNKKGTIFVGLSGGVDSSVALLRLQNEGYDVVGVFIKTWHPDFIECNEEQERLDAMRVAAHLKVPFLTFDAEEVYKRDVADYMISEYKAGRTPNPDVMCNQHVKFGAFLDFALTHGADKVATGHYARVKEENGVYTLLRGTDTNKDQSYFLWTLTQAQLSKIIFPIGDTTKPEIREEALRAGLPTAAKHDSQGVCFLGEIDMKDFLSHYIETKQGEVLSNNGTVIGTHDGALYYTLGQRHGFIITEQTHSRTPHYVVSKNLDANTITVDIAPIAVGSDCVTLSNLVLQDTFEAKEPLTAQFRYRQKPFPIQLKRTDDDHAILEVLEEIEKPSVGQSCVLYSNDECLGGGIITN